MNKIILIALLLFSTTPDAFAQIHLSPVNCGDCIADRIYAKRTTYVEKLKEKYCSENNPNKASTKKCIENGKSERSFAFFTDRCSESDYFIGIDGSEVCLKRTSKKPGKPHYFVGSYTGKRISIAIVNPLLVKKEYDTKGSKKESDVISATYKVDVIVKKGNNYQKFNNVTLSSGF